MNRLKFRAIVEGSCYTEDGEDKEVEFELNEVAVYPDGNIGVFIEYLEYVIDKLDLTDYEKKSLLQYFIDNGGYDDWVNIVPKTIYQCTGFTDKNDYYIYEYDMVKRKDCIGEDDYIVKYYDEDGVYRLVNTKNKSKSLILGLNTSPKTLEIILDKHLENDYIKSTKMMI